MEQGENRELFLTDTQIIKDDEYDVEVYREIRGNNVYYYIKWSKDGRLRWKYSFVTLLFYDDDSQDPETRETTSLDGIEADNNQDHYDELDDEDELEAEKGDLKKFITFLSQEEVGGFLDYWNEDDVRRGMYYWMGDAADDIDDDEDADIDE